MRSAAGAALMAHPRRAVRGLCRCMTAAEVLKDSLDHEPTLEALTALVADAARGVDVKLRAELLLSSVAAQWAREQS